MLSPDQQQELLDSVVEDFTLRLRKGERPAISEYTEKHPVLSGDIEELLTSVAMIEELKTQNPPTHGSLKREMKEILKLDRIGDYRIVKELGRGGMGIVFEAVHESLGRRVAIKVMPNRTFDDQKYLERFRREAQAAANLHHTNIVSVFGIGQTGEHHYYVMEFVDGESLSGILARLNQQNESVTHDGKVVETVADGGEISTNGKIESFELATESAQTPHLFNSSRERVRWAAELGDQIADGLAYAHALGTLHRDIKPANLLVDKNETIWLTDFGLVKNLGSQTITKTGDIIGTPQYMAPESFEGQYDERSETYCLGLTLYEMVTLKPAFENASTPELIRRITTTTPIPPRKLDRKIPLDLERVIQKAISKEPRYRYQSAEELRDDLRAFLDDRPINARKISMAENIWRWSRRNPLPAAMSLLTGLMICLIAITATVALSINNRALLASEKNERALKAEYRRADYNLGQYKEIIKDTHKAYDRMFRAKVLDESELTDDISLDGFMNLEGISASIDESDAAFLEHMLEYYLQFAEDNRIKEDSLKEMSAKSFRRVANIYHLIGQFDEAVEAYDKSIAVYEELRSSKPKSIPDALNLVRTIKEKGRALELNSLPGDRKKVEAEFVKAVTILREHENADHFPMRIELAKTLVMQSFPGTYMPLSLPDRFTQLRNDTPALFSRRSDRGFVGLIQAQRRRMKQGNRADLGQRERAMLGQLRRSDKLIREASEIADELVKDKPLNDEVQFVHAICWARWSIILQAKNDYEKANKAIKSASSALSKLRDARPEHAEYEFALAQIYAIPRRTLASEIASLEKAKEIMLQLSQRYDRNHEYKQFLGNVCGRLGRLHRESNRPDAAEQNLYLAYENYKTLTPITPRNLFIQIGGLYATLNYVDTLIHNGKSNDAIIVLDDSIAEVNEMQNNQSFRVMRSRLAKKKVALLNALAIVLDETGNHSAANKAQKEVSLMMREAPGRKKNRKPTRERQSVKSEAN